MATAVLGSEGLETLDGDPYDKPCSSPSNSASGGGGNCVDIHEGCGVSGKDIERYVKFFTLKSVQVVVQSRLGKKGKTENMMFSTGADWFNVNIEDNLEVQEQTKEVLKSHSSSTEIPIVIEISLQSITDPNTKLILELWSILFDRTDSSPTNSSRIINNVYNRMSVLLKSLICVTRALPAYKLSRKLSLSDEDEFKLYYNVFSAISLFKGERGTPFFKTKVNKDSPQGQGSSFPKEFSDGGMLHEYIDYGNVLGEGFKLNQIGKVVTPGPHGQPYGTLTLEVAYRTKMELSSNFSRGCGCIIGDGSLAHPGSNKLMIKSDHYAVENTLLYDNPAIQGFSRHRNRSTPVSFGMMGRENMRPLVPGSPRNSPTSSPVTTNKKHLAAAFVDDPSLFSPINEETDMDDPLGNLLKKSMMLHQKRNQDQQNESEEKNSVQDVDLKDGHNSKTLTNDETVALEQDESSSDFVLVDLKALPFAGAASSSSGTVDSSDPIHFFQEVQHAPISLESIPSAAGDDSGSLITDEDLKSFESEMVVFDDFVKKLISSDQSPAD